MPDTRSKSDKIWVVAALLLAALLGWVSLQTHRADGQTKVSFPRGQMEILRSDGSKVAFKIEIATSLEQQEYGLMNREAMPADSGMIFLWPQDQVISMWMKNTLIPLDMLFVLRDGHITKIAANAIPNDLTSIRSEVPVRAVIEIGGGEAARQNIKVGDTILYPAFNQPK